MNKPTKMIGQGLLMLVFLASFAAASTVTLWPSGQGAYAAWNATGCSSPNGWQCVDETPANASDYLSTQAKQLNESFTFQDASLTGATINNLTLFYYATRYASNRYQMQPLLRIGGRNYLGSVISLTSSYSYYTQTYMTNPATGSAWTPAEINALEAGMMSYSANYGGKVAQVYAVVGYTIPDSCSETDGGDVITVKGNTSGYLNQTYYNYADYCVDTSNVYEYYCSGAYKQNRQESCGTDGYVGNNYCIGQAVYRNYTDYFCGSGACASTTYPAFLMNCTAGQYCSNGQCMNSDSCTDSDGGDVITVKGNTSGYLNNTYYTNLDYCVDSSNVYEYYCSGAYKQNRQESCGTDGYVSASYCIGQGVWRNYTDYYCSTGACASSTYPTWQQNCTAGQYCSGGQCINNDSCTDSDGGNVITVKGNTTGFLNNTYYSNVDYCVDYSNVFEYYCSGTAKQSQQENCGTDGYVSGNYCIGQGVYKNYTDYYCGSGACSSTPYPVMQENCSEDQYCSEGMCMMADSCSDTDGGYVPMVTGTVSGLYNQSPYSATDDCLNDYVLLEYYCTGNQYTATMVNCTMNGTACSSGHCF